jgi:hypothetical protein
VRELRPDLGDKLEQAREPAARYVALSEEAEDLARAWLSLPPARRGA